MGYSIRLFKDNMFIVSSDDGRVAVIDSRDKEYRKYFSPMELILIAVGGCTSVDVVSILNKMRQNIKELEVHVDGRRRREYPKIYEEVTLEYHIKGDADPDKVKKAIELSMSKYCSASITVRRAGAKVKYRIFLNGREIPT